VPQLSGNFGEQQAYLTAQFGSARPAAFFGPRPVIFDLSLALDPGHDLR